MLCSLLLLARSTEGILYDIIQARLSEKNEEYNKLPLKSIEQIYAGIEVNLKDKYIFEERGIIEIKGKGEMFTYFLIARKD